MRGLARRGATRRRPTPSRGGLRLSRERAVRGGFASLAPQGCARRTRAPARRGAPARGLLPILSRLPARARRRGPRLRRPQRDAGAARLREADRDRLLGRARAVLALADVVHLLADELTRLRARGLALPAVALRPFDGLLLRHAGLLQASRLQATCPIAPP